MKCHLCGISAQQCKGWLTRINEKGVEGVWECMPMCGANLPQEERLKGAIEGPEEH